MLSRAPTHQAKDAIAIIEQWEVGVTGRGIERLDPGDDAHVASVAALLRNLIFRESEVPTAIPADRIRLTLALARRLCAWAGHAHELAVWLVRVAKCRTVESLVGYLVRAAKKGLGGHSAAAL